ncbi:MAG TPA: choice-of-anchor tandem repeat GloVer-containing protein [Rhizomicrobium sp.]
MTEWNWRFALGAGLMAFLASGAASARSENTLLTFTGTNGSGPWTGVVEVGKGHFYGATFNGGANGTGAVYELRQVKEGKWKEKVIYSFGTGGSGDGAYPQMPWLVVDSNGNLYGTTPNGGAHELGTVFKLSPGKRHWSEQILYSFAGGDDGDQPIGGVTLDSNGNLYGTTTVGGGSANCLEGCGAVFELTPQKNGTWTESILHAFTGIPQGASCGDDYDGQNPYRATLVIDAAGNVFGTTQLGGAGCGSFGTVWELSPARHGHWKYSVIHVMPTVAGDAYPDAGGVLDSDGNFYFAEGGGSIYELVKAQGYQEQTLYQYPGPGAEGDYDTVNFDKAGNLYWTSAGGGGQGYQGTVEKLTPDGQGGWKHSTLYAFASGGPAGVQPFAGVTVDASGKIYGSCGSGGGSQGNASGTVFEIAP